MSDVSKLIAEKLGIDQSKPDWVSLTINEACTLKRSNVVAKEIIDDLETKLAEILPFAVFIENTLNDDKVSDLFKTKLKKHLVNFGFKVTRNQYSGDFQLKYIKKLPGIAGIPVMPLH